MGSVALEIGGLIERMVERGMVRLPRQYPPRSAPRGIWSEKPNARNQRRWRAKNPDLARQRTREGMRKLREQRRQHGCKTT